MFKNEDESDPNNYRPISLLSVFNRIFEKLMYKRLKSFIDKYDILSKSQYGFRENCSTQHTLIDIVNKMQLNFDKKLYPCGIFIDLKVAYYSFTGSRGVYHKCAILIHFFKPIF